MFKNKAKTVHFTRILMPTFAKKKKIINTINLLAPLLESILNKLPIFIA